MTSNTGLCVHSARSPKRPDEVDPNAPLPAPPDAAYATKRPPVVHLVRITMETSDADGTALETQTWCLGQTEALAIGSFRRSRLGRSVGLKFAECVTPVTPYKRPTYAENPRIKLPVARGNLP
jgi:hypothetical protein